MTTVAFSTLGCKVNQYDTDVMKTSFSKRGYSIVGFSEKADVYIINTCTVTGTAARKSRQMVSKARKTNTDALVVVTGCLGQLESSEVKYATDADIVTGNAEKEYIVELVEEYGGSGFIRNEDIFKEMKYLQALDSTQEDRARVYIKVQEGCNNFCSYCAIPFARGRSRSRNPADAVNEVRSYVKKGTKEVVITGIHLDAYGDDLEEADLISLLEEIDVIEGLSGIRLGSLEPASITPEFVKRAAALKHLCPHFHLSLQSGCDETLERMKRRYTTGQFRRAVELIRRHVADAAITTDIIVGFPGETDEEFLCTKDFIETMAFMKIHIFPYSPRKGTLAYGMPGRIPGDIKKKRSEILNDISRRGFERFVRSISDKVHEAIAERESEDFPGYWEGHTGNYVKVLFKCSDCIPGLQYMIRFNNIVDDFVVCSLHSDAKV